jgi:hypothetical protein
MDVNRNNAFYLAREIIADNSLPGEDDPTEHNPDAYAEHVRATELARYVLAIGPTLRAGALDQIINSIDNFIAGYELSDGQLEHLKALRMRVQVELEG